MDPEVPHLRLGFLGDRDSLSKWRNHLPHWQASKPVSYFITFRLADSLPQPLLNSWKTERSQWCRTHPKPWDATTEADYHRRFSSRIDKLLDAGHGSNQLADPQQAAILEGILNHHNHGAYLLHSWVIMPNHIHLLATISGDKPLNSIVAGWKRFSATRIHQQTSASGPLWQKDYFDRIIRDWDHFLNVGRYIRNNPAKAGLKNGSFLLYESNWMQRLLGG